MSLFSQSAGTETKTITSTLQSTMSSTGSFANGFRAFAGNSHKLPPSAESFVESESRKTLVNTLVKHAVRCVRVQEMERSALVIQKYWRSFAANRELRRRRWAARRARAAATALATVTKTVTNLPRTLVRAIGALVWSFFLSFRIVRALVWFAVRAPRSFVKATYSWEGAFGFFYAAYVAAKRKHPDSVFLYNFQDFLAAYVVVFVALDVFVPVYFGKALRANKVLRRHTRRGVQKVSLFAASKLNPPGEKKAHVLLWRVGILDAVPIRTVILSPISSPPLAVPTKRSKDPELLKAIQEAHQAARDSNRFADEAATAVDALETQLEKVATQVETHVLGKLEGRLRELSEVSEAQYNAAKAMMSGHGRPQVMVNTNLVDERIDKRFEDMEAMLREARDEGRAEGFKELDRVRRPSVALELEADDTDVVRRSMERGIHKGVELEKERRRAKSVTYKIKSALGLKSAKKKREMEKRQLDELKGAILAGDFSPPPPQRER
jgi:hypothetical protein|tara:strand:- start:2269 stop:3756 length:1488 start_codon:yes stop_codon:yes gene_type:complete